MLILAPHTPPRRCLGVPAIRRNGKSLYECKSCGRAVAHWRVERGTWILAPLPTTIIRYRVEDGALILRCTCGALSERSPEHVTESARIKT
jgi:hypothetical protein